MQALPRHWPDSARLPRDRREAGELGRLRLAERADLGHEREDRGGGDLRDAGDRCQDPTPFGQVLVGGDARRDLGLHRVEVALDAPEPGRRSGGAAAARAKRLRPVLRRRAVLDQRPAGGAQLGQIVLGPGPRDDWAAGRAPPPSAPASPRRPVRPGLHAGRFGKPPGPARIDLDEGDAGLGQAPLQLQAVASRRREDDAAPVPAEPSAKPPQTRGRVGEAGPRPPCPPCPVAVTAGLEPVFRDVDADDTLRHLSRSHACHPRRDPRVSVRVKVKDGGGQTSCRPPKGQAPIGPHPATARRQRRGVQRLLPSVGAERTNRQALTVIGAAPTQARAPPSALVAAVLGFLFACGGPASG